RRHRQRQVLDRDHTCRGVRSGAVQLRLARRARPRGSHPTGSPPDPIRSAFLAMSLDDQWVNRTPSQMVEAELADFAERFEMVLEDLAALPADRVVADGFGLLLELLASATPDRSPAIFLLPTPALRHWA